MLVFSRLLVASGIGAAIVLSSGTATSAEESMTFRRGCAGGQRLVMAAVGDLLFHNSLQRQALRTGQSYRQFWSGLAPVLSAADVAYGNLEGPAAAGVAPGGRETRDPGRRFDGHVYGAAQDSLVFNFHPSVLADLAETGFDIVSTANNHAADRGPLGIERTLDAADARGVAAAGTRRRDARERKLAVKTATGGMTIAWLACTFSVNGMPDTHGQVVNCYGSREKLLEEIRWNAADPDVDAVIVTPHWGVELAAKPLEHDRAYAREMIEAGATAVIGTHPHVVQGWEKITTAAGRDGLVVYSTGNFISNQVSDEQRTGIVAIIELTRLDGGKAEVSAAGFIPTWVTRGRHRVDEMRIDVARGARAFPAALRRLPAGNHVTAGNFRNLRRNCAVTAEAGQP